MIELFRYRRDDGQEPFTEWLNGIRDKMAQARIRVRLQQVRSGNFGDRASVGSGIMELRIHIGPGYRVYFGRQGQLIVILLCGEDKSTQAADIKQAKALWLEWKGRKS